MNYLQSIAYLETLTPATAPKLERMQKFMAELGNLQDQLVSLHVGGTNGKGSCVSILDSVLRAGGLKVGRFTGPHLLRWNERFHIDGKAISDDQFAKLSSRLRIQSEEFGRKYPNFGPLTWFEMLAAMAFVYFVEQRVDVAVIEVGLGGRWDATNVLSSPCVTAITNVDLDHTQILGETVRQIAAEKAGIIKPGVPVVTAASGDALDEIEKVAKENNSTVIRSNLLPEGVLGDLRLLGSHQKQNAMVALLMIEAAAKQPKFAEIVGKKNILDPDVISRGFKNVYWPGRFQLIPEKHLILDGAHNPAGAKALRVALDEMFAGRKFTFVLGCFANKDVSKLLTNFLRVGDKVIATEAATKRQVADADVIARMADEIGCSASCVKDVGQALKLAFQQRKNDELIVVTGSFYLVKETMLALGWRQVEQGDEVHQQLVKQ